MLNLHVAQAPVNEESMTRVPSPAPLWLLGTLLVGACAPAPAAPPGPGAPRPPPPQPPARPLVAGPPVPTRPPTTMPEAWPLFARLKADPASSGMVVSGSPLASQVGVELLRRGRRG